MSEPKRHHYLPQFYLKGFCDKNGKLSVYDREKKEYREQQSPNNTAFQGHYYTSIGKDGSKNTDIEKFFSYIEGQTKSIIEKIDNRQQITDLEKEGLSIFISFQKVRVPTFEKTHNEFSEKAARKLGEIMFSSDEMTTALISDYEKETGKKIGVPIKDLTDFVLKGEYDVKFPKGAHLTAMLYSGVGIGKYLFQMDWEFIYAPPKKSFITSDNPFSLIPPRNHNKCRGVGIITPGAVKLIPLSAKTCLIIFDRGNKTNYRLETPEKVRDINKYTTIGCDRLLIGENLSLLKSLVEATKIYNIKETPRVSIT